MYDHLYDRSRVGDVARWNYTPPGKMIRRGGDICDGNHTDEVLCVKCYITDIIDITPSGWLA
jgi:hypothetical protein